MSTQPRNDGTERYRRVLDGFGSGSIQGTEDWPIDPTVEDAKTIGIAITLALAFLSAPGPWPVLATGAALSLAGGFLIVYLAPSDRAPYRWIYSILQFKLGTKRFTKHSEDSTEQTRPSQGSTACSRGSAR
jgi:hypothetical protein